MKRSSWVFGLLLSIAVPITLVGRQDGLGLESSESIDDPETVVPGERMTLLLGEEDRVPGTELFRRVLCHETTGAGQLVVWAESEEIDCVLKFRKSGTSLQDERPAVAGRTPALFHLGAEPGTAWRFAIEGKSTGSVRFQLTEIPEVEGLDRAVEAARAALKEVKRLRQEGREEEAADGRVTAVDELVQACAGSYPLPCWNALWDLAMEGRGDPGAARRKQEWTRLVEVLERTGPSRSVDLATACTNLAYAFEDLREFAEEVPLLLAAIEVLEPIQPKAAAMLRSARLTLGVCYARRREFVRARQVLERFLWEYESSLGPEHRDVLRSKNTLGNVLMELGEIRGAERLYRLWLEIYPEKFPSDAISIALVRGNLANIHALRGRFSEARELQEEVVATLRERLGPGHDRTVQAEANHGRILSKLDEATEAVSILEEVLAIRLERLSETHPEVQDARFALACALEKCGERERAIELHRLVLEQRARLYPPGHAHLMSSQETLAEYLAWLGREEELLALASEYAEGIRSNVRGALALSQRERTAEVRRGAGKIDNLILWLGLIEPEGFSALVLELVESYRILSGRSPRLLAEGDEDAELRALREQVLACHVRASELASAAAAGDDSGTKASDLGVAFTERDAAQRALREELVERGLWYFDEVSIADIARAMPPDCVAVSFWRMGKGGADPLEPGQSGRRGYFCALLLFPDGVAAAISLAPADEVEQAGRRWRAALGVPFSGRNEPAEVEKERAAGEALRKLIVDPMLDLLEEGEKLYVCLDDLLYLLPLDALPLGDGRLGERFEIRNLAFLSELVRRDPSAEGPPSLLAVGGVDFGAVDPAEEGRAVEADADLRGGLFDELFPPLERTGKEVEGIAFLFERRFDRPGRVLTGEEASKAAFLSSAPGTRYLHLATHGAFADAQHRAWKSAGDSKAWGDVGWLVEREAPLSLCGLALAGANGGAGVDGAFPGILTGEELAGLDLAACELAVLSACESSVGLRTHGLGLWSLQNALRSAGTRVTLTSLWPVRDEWASRLMAEFYRRLWGAGKESPSTALWDAKRVLREEGAPPRDWAGWVLCGDVGEFE